MPTGPDDFAWWKLVVLCDRETVSSSGDVFGCDFVHFVQENAQSEPRQQKLDCHVSAHGLAASVPRLCTFTLRHKINKVTPKRHHQ